MILIFQEFSSELECMHRDIPGISSAEILRLPMTYSKLSRKYFRLETKSSKREAEKYLMQYTVERSTNTRARYVKRPPACLSLIKLQH